MSTSTAKLLLFAGVMGVLVTTAKPTPAQTETVLYSFTGSPDGNYPSVELVLDAQGNLYGTTWTGGAYGQGSAFKLTPTGTETVLHSFPSPVPPSHSRSLSYRGPWIKDGGSVPSGRLVLDAQGNLYGETEFGGLTSSYGTVFKLDTTGAETVLHMFRGGTDDGKNPIPQSGGLVFDAQGNLYGTTWFGGDLACIAPDGCGTVFKLDTTGAETVLHMFRGGVDGALPIGLVIDSAGNLYGNTYQGGAYDCGTVFELAPDGTETVLYSFAGGPNDGAGPQGNLVRDNEGDLYGTTWAGGLYGWGTVFKITPAGEETLLYSFAGSPDGERAKGVTIDAQGNIYGTTLEGGAYGGGTVFEVTQTGAEVLLHSFSGDDGWNPEASVVLDAQGNLYGTTWYGGVGSNCSSGCGVVFKVVP